MPEVVIKTDEGKGKEYKVDERIKGLSKLIKGQLEFSSEAIPVKISSEVFEKVLEYFQQHDYNPPVVEKPLKSSDITKNLSDKDVKFISQYDLESIKGILDAAYYLEIDTLKDVCIARIATEFYIGNTVEDIEKLKSKFGVTKDLTIEEEEALAKEYPWAKEETEITQKAGGLILEKDIMMVEESKN